MASVGKDVRDGRWLARWRDPSGRQHKKSFPRRVDAQRWLDQMQAELHRGQYIDPAGSKLKMRDFAPHWVAGLAHLKVSTATRYRGIVEVHVVPTWGSWALGDIRHSDVQAWIAMLTARGLKPGTIRQAHRVLSLILDGAVQDGRIARNPARGVRLPRQVRGEPRILTAEQVAQMIEVAGEEGASVAVLAFTGLRFGELAALKVRRVDWVNDG